MAEIRPFRALRFTDKAGDISKNVCPPYDIISEEERLGYLHESENNIIRLELPRGEEPYKKAAEDLRVMLSSGVLRCDAEDGIYIYEEEFTAYGKRHKVKGIYTLVRLAEFSEGVVLPHEETLSKAKTDRFNLMSETYCNFSAIYSMYSDAERKVTSIIGKLSERKPDIEFTASDGVVQRLWCIYNKEEISAIRAAFADKKLYIADGHHRYETALAFRKKMLADGDIKSEDDLGNFVMMMLVDMENDGLVVFPTHRLVRDLKSYDREAVKKGLAKYFDVTPVEKSGIEKALDEGKDGKVYVWCAGNGEYFSVALRDKESAEKRLGELFADKSSAYRNLDVTVLHSLILEEIFGIDRENMANQINLTYTRSIDEATDGVDSGKFDCAFIINPTKVSEIRDVAAAGDKMPQKSTYFYPKLITGLVMNKIKDI